ncbi:MAG: hypothetical protein V9E94_06760 [Microthrixaceae bacterium]
MADITAQDVKALRDATGAGMKDAKNALVEADGDRDKAAQILRQKGLSKVATLEDRENNQGTVAIAREGNVAAMVQLKSETDFAGKSEDFVELVQKMADAVLADGEAGLEKLADALDTLRVAKTREHRDRQRRCASRQRRTTCSTPTCTVRTGVGSTACSSRCRVPTRRAPVRSLCTSPSPSRWR